MVPRDDDVDVDLKNRESRSGPGVLDTCVALDPKCKLRLYAYPMKR